MKKNSKQNLVAKIVCGLVLASLCLSSVASIARANSDVPDNMLSTAQLQQSDVPDNLMAGTATTADAAQRCTDRLRNGETCTINLYTAMTQRVLIEASDGAKITGPVQCGRDADVISEDYRERMQLQEGNTLRQGVAYMFNSGFDNCTFGLTAITR